MSIDTIALLVGGLLIVGLAGWIIWPRKPRRGPNNNWRQRDPDELFSAPSTAAPLGGIAMIGALDACDGGGGGE